MAYNNGFCITHGHSYNDQCPECSAETQRYNEDKADFICPVEAQKAGDPLPGQASANDRQVGGAHYGKVEYQHWDFATDVELNYLIGCASKYPTRWRDKNGAQDLEKALHYLQKAEESDVTAMMHTATNFAALRKFTAQLPNLESRAVYCMCMSDYESAAEYIRLLLAGKN